MTALAKANDPIAARLAKSPAGRAFLDNAQRALDNARKRAATARSKLGDAPSKATAGSAIGAAAAGAVDQLAAQRGIGGILGFPPSTAVGAALAVYAMSEDDVFLAAIAGGMLAPVLYTQGSALAASYTAPAPTEG